VYEVKGKQYIAFYGSDFEKPGENNIAWEGGAPGSQGYYVFGLP
jgi:hypothetical protein